jgi:aldose sugar dehydrogenase
MSKFSLIVLFPAIILILAVASATFYHEYDFSRITVSSLNLTLQDLDGLAGNIISLQKDSSGSIISIVSGKWQINKTADFANGNSNKSIGFESNFTTYQIDGKSKKSLSLSDFKLERSSITAQNATLDGTAYIRAKGKGSEINLNSSDTSIPLQIVIYNKRVFSISSDSDLFQSFFQKSPVYGKITYSPMTTIESPSPRSKGTAVSTQFVGGPIVNDSNLKVELVASGINFPSKMAFLGDKDLLVLEKNEGMVKRIINGVVQNDTLIDVSVANGVERGMLGIAADGTNSSLIRVFLYFTESNKDGDDLSERKIPLGNRLYRYDLTDGKLVNPKLLLDLPSTPGSAHNGGKLLLDGKGNIYLTIGDLNRSNAKKSNSTITMVQNNAEAKTPDGRAGILRITEDGRTVGSGIIGKSHPLDKYYAYGIRNSFGIAFDPLTGLLWDTENGPEYGDEINLVQPGFNSGWNKVQGLWSPIENAPGKVLSNYSNFVTFNETGKYVDPELSWYQPSPGLTSIIFLNSSKLGSKYTNDMFVSDFHNGNIYNFNLSANRTSLSLQPPIADKIVDMKNETNNVIFAKGFGAITDMATGPDGYLYVLSVFQGGADCDPIRHPNQPCVAYDKPIGGSVFRIVPK